MSFDVSIKGFSNLTVLNTLKIEAMAERDLYLCRRCTNTPSFSCYNNLRAHLRAVHRITQLPHSDLALYESFPGSRHYGPPFNNPENPATSGVDHLIQFRDDIIRSVTQAVTDNIQPPVVPEVNFQPLLTAFQTMHNDVVRGVKDGIKEAIATVMEQLKDSRENSRIEAIGVENVVQIKDGAAQTDELPSVETNTAPIEEDLPAKENPPVGEMEQIAANGDLVVENQNNGNPVRDPEMPNLIAIGTSTVAKDTMESQSNPLEDPLAQSTQFEPTKSDEELMDVVLPDDSVTVSQIVAELVSQTPLRVGKNVFANHNQFVCFI